MSTPRGRRAHLVLSGVLGTGKTTLARALASQAGYRLVSAREALRLAAGRELATRRDLQDYGLEIEAATGGDWLGVAVARLRLDDPHCLIVVDSARTTSQVHAVRGTLAVQRISHVHLAADEEELRRRFETRGDAEDVPFATFDEAVAHTVEHSSDALARSADLVVDTTGLTPEDVVRHVLQGTAAQF